MSQPKMVPNVDTTKHVINLENSVPVNESQQTSGRMKKNNRVNNDLYELLYGLK